jgi:hypothetical protein
MLVGRKIMATLAGETMEGSVTRSCLQGGILSPLLWMNSIRMAVIHMGYADDIAILIHGKFPNTISELLQETLSMAQQWYDRAHLSISSQKTVITPFIRKRVRVPDGTNSLWTHIAADY